MFDSDTLLAASHTASVGTVTALPFALIAVTLTGKGFWLRISIFSAVVPPG